MFKKIRSNTEINCCSKIMAKICTLIYGIYIKDNLDRGPREDYPARG